MMTPNSRSCQSSCCGAGLTSGKLCAGISGAHSRSPSPTPQRRLLRNLMELREDFMVESPVIRRLMVRVANSKLFLTDQFLCPENLGDTFLPQIWVPHPWHVFVFVPRVG